MSEKSQGERVTALETDISHIKDDICRINQRLDKGTERMDGIGKTLINYKWVLAIIAVAVLSDNEWLMKLLGVML